MVYTVVIPPGRTRHRWVDRMNLKVWTGYI